MKKPKRVRIQYTEWSIGGNDIPETDDLHTLMLKAQEATDKELAHLHPEQTKTSLQAAMTKVDEVFAYEFTILAKKWLEERMNPEDALARWKQIVSRRKTSGLVDLTTVDWSQNG